jgi:hypothetical protein
MHVHLLTGLFLRQCLARMETIWGCYCCLQAKRKRGERDFSCANEQDYERFGWTHHGVQEYWELDESLSLYGKSILCVWIGHVSLFVLSCIATLTGPLGQICRQVKVTFDELSVGRGNFLESIWQGSNWLNAQGDIRCLLRWTGGFCAWRGRFVNH